MDRRMPRNIERQRGSTSTSALALVATTGLLGAAYYGYHQHSTGNAIKKLVPEWEVASLHAQAVPVAPLVCTKDPPDTANPRRLPGFNFTKSIPGTEHVCKAIKLPPGAITVSVATGSQLGTPHKTVGKTCLEHQKGTRDITGTLSACSASLSLTGVGYDDFFEHGCKSCAAERAPEHSCSGLMCRMETQAFALRATGGVGKEGRPKNQAAARVFSATVRVEMNGLEIKGGRHTVKNGRDPECGDCTREILPEVTGPRKDCVKTSLNIPLGSHIRIAAEGAFAVGPMRGAYTGSARITSQVKMTEQQGECGADVCTTGQVEVEAGHEGRFENGAGGARLTGGVRAVKQSCSGRWVATDCEGPGSVPNTAFKCGKLGHLGNDPNAGDYIF
jgi:hypothetical protein